MNFTEWLPDQPDMTGGIAGLSNAIPMANGYRCINALLESTTALDGACVGGFWVQDDSSTYYVFAGDDTKLYSLSTGTFSNVSKAGNYSVSSWEFVKWGERVIAASVEEPMQYFDMGTSALFADLPGSPPKAKHIAVIRDFIVAGNLDEGGTLYPSRLRWSGYNNSELWVSSQATQSDFQDLRGHGGAIQKITPGETGLVMRENSISRMTYVGPPLIFRIDEVEPDLGVRSANSVCWSGDSVYFYSHDGFYVKQGDVPSTPIGDEKIDRFFANDFDGSTFEALKGAVDRKNTLICWVYPSKGTGKHRMLIYSPTLNKWGVSDSDARHIMEFTGPAYNLDTLTTSLGLADIDTDSFPMDSDIYAKGTVSLGGFTPDHKLGLFTGEPLTAVIETPELTGGRQAVKGVRVHSDGDLSMEVGTRDNLSENVTWSALKTPNRLGSFDFRTSARYHRFRVYIGAGFNEAQGIDIDSRQEGRT